MSSYKGIRGVQDINCSILPKNSNYCSYIETHKMFLTDSSSWNVCLVGLFYSILSEFLLVFHDENNVKFTRDA
jgi:hypothetical protein